MECYQLRAEALYWKLWPVEPLYSGRDLFVLRPKTAMGAEELMFYAVVRANKWRYSHGRRRPTAPWWVYPTLPNA